MSALQPQRSGKSATAAQYTHAYYTGSNAALAEFMQWCDDNGVIAPALILHRWVRANAPHKSYKNTSLGVMLKDDCIHVKDFTTDERFTFFDYKPPTATQYRWQHVERKRVARIAEQQRQAAHEEVGREAAQLWLEATEAPATGYFASKGLTDTHGAKWHERLNCWLVLVSDIEGTIYTIQKIYNKPAPNKFFLKGGRTAGGMVVIGSLITASRILVCEGFATGGTLREESHETVVCALSSGNLLAVCTALRAEHPVIEIIVCGDNDRFAHDNIGRRKAIEAAQEVSGKYCFPEFSDDCRSCNDYNDVVNCDLCGGAS